MDEFWQAVRRFRDEMGRAAYAGGSAGEIASQLEKLADEAILHLAHGDIKEGRDYEN